MKKPLLKLFTLTLLSATSVSIAQPILTAAGTNPVIGESFTIFNTSYVSPGNAGANQTWDLSTLSGTSGGLTNIVTPSSTTTGSSFPNSNIAWSNSTGGINYFKTSSTALQFYGVGGSTVTPYSDPEDFLRFPFAFNNTYIDNLAGQYQSSGYTFYRKGTVTVTADGYGTLISPTGSYSNVMRVHFVEAYQDSAFFGVPYVTTFNTDQYMWYKNGTHVQLAAVYTTTSSMGSPYTGGMYVTGTVGINDASDLISSSNLFPNPANDRVTVDFTLTENKKLEVQIFNTLGQQAVLNQSVDGTQGLNTIQLDITDLTEGIYFAQIIVEGNITATKRFVVSK